MLKAIARLLLILLVVAIGGAWWVRSRLVTPYRGFGGEKALVEIPPGTGVTGIAQRLVGSGVVPDVWTFRLAAKLDGVDRRLQAGEYRFTVPATPSEVADRIARGDVFKKPVTFPEGLTFREMGAIFERADLGTAADFDRAASDGTIAAGFDPDATTLEGFLFPDTYAMPSHTDADTMVRAMVTEFSKQFDATLRADATARQMTAHDVVTLASIVEKETARAEERPLVAAVYQNRLRLHMPLQCDPTVIYALMQAGRWDGNIRKGDLQIDSPYNTYRYAGLPPGPIASPGRPSIEAAIHPADVPYLYFVSKGDGSHVFAATLDEHNRNVAKYQLGRGK
jgi:UPF0755 protein